MSIKTKLFRKIKYFESGFFKKNIFKKKNVLKFDINKIFNIYIYNMNK